jgi:signal transduction histidine kinase
VTEVLPRAFLSRRRAPAPDLVGADPKSPDPGSVRRVRPRPVETPRSARSKIIRLIAVTLVTLTFLVGTSAGGLWLLHHRVTVLADEVAPETAANTGVRVAMLDAETGLRGYLLTGRPDFLEPYRAARPEIRQHLDELTVIALDDAELNPLIADQRSATESWLTQYADPIVAGTVGAGDSATLDRAKAAFDHFRATNDAVTRTLGVRTDAMVRQSRLLTEVGIAMILVVGVGGKAMVIRPGLRALRMIGPPLEALHTTVRSLRGGNLTARADTSEGVLEIRAVASAVNELADTNDRQRSYLAEQLNLAEAVRQIGLVIGNSLALEEVIDNSVAPVAEHFHTSSTWIRAWEGKGELPGRGRRAVFPPTHDLYAPDVLISVARRAAYLGWQRQTYTLLSRTHPRDDDFVSAADQEALLRHIGSVGAASLLLIPVGVGAECLGYLALSRATGQVDWTVAELTALLQVGRDLGRAILHARIFEREQELVSELQALDVKKRDFVSMVSHELRTPLSSIIGHLEIIRSGDLGFVPDDMETSLTAMDRNSVRLTRLIEDLLLISRIEEGAQPTKLHPLDLTSLAHEVAGLHAEPAEQRGVRLRVDADEAVPVLGDSDELERVVSNLLSNAIKFSPPGGVVRLRVRTDGSGASIQVSDQGLGISAEDQDQLFTRFFRSNNPEALAVPGTGLGLTITKLIVSKHRGEISVASKMGHGSTFTVTLPPADLLLAVTQHVEPHRRSDDPADVRRSTQPRSPSPVTSAAAGALVGCCSS